MKSVGRRASEFAHRHGRKWSPGDFMEGEEAKVQFWKWYGFVHGAAFGWKRGYTAGKKR